MTLQYGGGKSQEITIEPGQSVWFFRDNAINQSNQIVDGNLIIYSSKTEEELSGPDGYDCPGLVVSEYIYKSTSGNNRYPNNSTYGFYASARSANSGSSTLACTTQNYDSFAGNDMTEVNEKYGRKGTDTIATYSPKPIQVGVSNYIPKISVELDIKGNFDGLATYMPKSGSWRNGVSYVNNYKKALAVSIPSYARILDNYEQGVTKFDPDIREEAYKYDIIPLSNSSYRNPAGYYGSYKDILLNNNSTSTNGWSNWNVPTVMEYTITNDSSAPKDYVIYAENAMNVGENGNKFAQRIPNDGSATFVYRRDNTGDTEDKVDGTWSFSQCYTDDASSKNCSQSDSVNDNYELNENGSEGVATIAAMGTIKANETKTVSFVSYLVNQCSASMYYKVRIVPSNNATSYNDALNTLKR